MNTSIFPDFLDAFSSPELHKLSELLEGDAVSKACRHVVWIAPHLAAKPSLKNSSLRVVFGHQKRSLVVVVVVVSSSGFYFLSWKEKYK